MTGEKYSQNENFHVDIVINDSCHELTFFAMREYILERSPSSVLCVENVLMWSTT